MILVEEGQSPLILCLPHSGADVPAAVTNRFNATGRLQADLAWRLERVYAFQPDLDVTVIRSSISRYVIDIDRDPATPLSAALDPAVSLCPATTLDGKRIYNDGEEPGPAEVEQRVMLFHEPFHKALRSQIDRLMRRHHQVIVIDCQSMRSQIKGVTGTGLPVVNIGSADGSSCDIDLRNVLAGSFNGLEGVTVGVDEQTRGGYITRSYGMPERGLHALTLLLAQRAYLRHESPPFEPDKSRIAQLQSVLAASFVPMMDWVEKQGCKQQTTVAPDPLPETAAQDNDAPDAAPDPGFSETAVDTEERPENSESAKQEEKMLPLQVAE